MSKHSLTLCLAIGLLGHALAQPPQNPGGAENRGFDVLWTEARGPHEEGRYQESERLHQKILEKHPESQRAALRLAIAQERQGKLDEALASYDAALEIDPKGAWADFALFYKARAAQEGGAVESAIRAIEDMRFYHPDSPFNARGDILRVRIEGGDEQLAEERLERELQAAGIIDRARQFSKQGKDAEAKRILEELTESYSDAYCQMRAVEMLGHLAIRNRKHDEAKAYFENIVAEFGEESPLSRIVGVARMRLAGLSQIRHDYASALENYSAVLSAELDKGAVRSNTVLQTAGALFEVYQRQDQVSSGEWRELREMLQQAADHEEADRDIQVRAELMIVESRCWENYADPEIPRLVEAFLASYPETSYQVERSTARILLGVHYHHIEKYESALAQWDIVVQDHEHDEYIWKGMDHLPRVYYFRYAALKYLGEPTALQAAQALVDRFPDSVFAGIITSEVLPR